MWRGGRWLIGPEMLALQGFPVDELNLEGIKDQQLRLLAGGATGCHKLLLGRLKYVIRSRCYKIPLGRLVDVTNLYIC
jgi:hypothetical protein